MLPNVESRMTPLVLGLVVTCSLLTVTANLMMRYGLLQAGGLTLSAGGVTNLIVRLARQPTFVVGVLLYGVAAVVWFRVLSLAEVSSSYPVLIGLTFTLVTIGAILLFKESVSTLKVAGILVILAGIVLIAKGRA